MEDFTNAILIPDNLPEIKKETFTQLDKKFLKILFIRMAIIFVISVGGLLTFFIFNKENIPNIAKVIISIVVALVFISGAVLTILGFPRKGYLVRENDISFQRGLITFKQTSVPFNRIQHVEVNQGVLAKIFKLSSIKIFTAGGNASDLSIPGLPEDVAQNLKAFLSEKISEHE